MKLLTFKWLGTERFGFLSEDEKTVFAVRSDSKNTPQSLMEFIELGSNSPDLLQQKASLDELDKEGLELLPPICPKAIFCIGLNYSDHAKEMGKEKTEYPTVFFRLPRNHVAHGEIIVAPKLSDTLDWEAELVVIIGKGGRYISSGEALDHVFGYSIYNEGSVRDYQHHTSQFGLGKCFQGSGAFGPVIVTADEFGNPYGQSIETRIDGEVVQSGPISNMLHTIEDVIEYISSTTELMPGDIICTGTPAGVGAGMKPQRFLKDGEQVDIHISGIGTLSNPVKSEA